MNLVAIVTLLPLLVASPATHLQKCAPVPSAAAYMPDAHEGVVAVVGDAVITHHDLEERVALRLAADPHSRSASELKRLVAEELAQLKREQLWLADALGTRIQVSQHEVDDALASELARDHLTQAQLSARLARAGVPTGTLRTVVAAGLIHAKAAGVKAPPLRYRFVADCTT